MKPSLRILITADPVGATWQYSLDLARGLFRLGHRTVLAPTGPAPTAGQAKAAVAVPGLRLVDPGLGPEGTGRTEAAMARTAEKIAALAAETEADIVQLNTPALAALADFGRPVVAVLHSCIASRWEAVEGARLPAELRWQVELVARGLRSAGAVVTPTSAFGASVQRHHGLDATPRTVHHGRSPVAVPNGIPHDFVFTSGRLWDEGKNFGMLDSAAGRIGVPVRAAGPLAGPNGARVLFDNIHCLGTLGEEELGRWLSARPVFVSAALHEPFGLAVLEAASAGCALVLSDIPTYRELWEEVAVFVDPRDEDGFARAIGNLVGDDFERAVLGRAARERAARYTPDAMAAQMANLYRGLLPAVRGPVLAAARAAA
ncbi:MAG TPA: glycosyltransferase family 4 protein [Allosphingosinicella sp.]|jgi:glycosyltransferase involved in cell wall biosynthesis